MLNSQELALRKQHNLVVLCGDWSLQCFHVDAPTFALNNCSVPHHAWWGVYLPFFKPPFFPARFGQDRHGRVAVVSELAEWGAHQASVSPFVLHSFSTDIAV